MLNVSYLFGAGASRSAVPIVKGFESEMAEMLDKLSKVDFPSDEYSEQGLPENINVRPQTELKELFLDDLRWLIKNTKQHASVDTFAKKLFLKGEEINLKKLKCLLSVFLGLTQYLKDYDRRYDTFFATILQNSINKFPDNLNIISWNYDMQFEIAYNEYSNSNQMQILQSELGITVKNEAEIELKLRRQNFGIYKVNGTAGYFLNSGRKKYFYYDFNNSSTFDQLAIKSVLTYFQNLSIYESCISFAWEFAEEKPIINKIKESLKNTVILVVIGYSFPVFNRTIDKEIMNSMPKLMKIYIQDPMANDLIDRMKSTLIGQMQDIVTIQPITSADEFYIPVEL